MVSIDAPGTVLEYIAVKIMSVARKRDRSATRTRTWVQTTVKFMMHVAGLGCLTMAGFSWNMIAGLVVAGLSFLILATWFNGSEDKTQPQRR